MKKLLQAALGCSMIVAAVAPVTAMAQSGKRIVAARAVTAPPLTVNRRSWLDMGTAARVGTVDTYISASTTLHEPVYASYIPDRFGQSTLPGRFDLPFNDNPRGPQSGGIFSDGF